MKDIISELNIPKQLLDKTEKFMTTIFGPSAKEIGELMADKIRFRRMKNQIEIFKKTIALLEENNLEAKELNLKTLVPLIEFSSLEEDEGLQDKWATLIASIASSPETGLEPKLVKTLSNLSAIDAKVLDFIYDCFIIQRKELFQKYQSRPWPKVKSEEEIGNASVVIRFADIKEKFKLTSEFTEICLDNLESLGLVKNEIPKVEVDNNSFDPAIIEDKQGKQQIDFELDLSAYISKSSNIYLTPYGVYFIKQCKLEMKKNTAQSKRL